MIRRSFSGLLLTAAIILFLTLNISAINGYDNEKVRRIVDSLSTEDKVNLVVGTLRDYVYWPDPAPGMPVRLHGEVDDPRGATAFSEGRVAGAAGDTYDLSSKGLRPIVMADGPAGLRIDAERPGDTLTYYCTAFPVATLLASTWDTELVREVGAAIGDESRRYGVDILLAPALNLMRSPLCGRNFEYYSEDPVVSGVMAAAFVNGVQSTGTGATLKHYAANNQETMRNGIDVIVSERALRDLYLEGFRIAVEGSHPMAVMTSYNSINGRLSAENSHLLNDILRGEWGFDGFVMTDWWGEGRGDRQIKAGNDMLMPGTWRQYDEIMTALTSNPSPLTSHLSPLTPDDLDRAVANIVGVMLATHTGRGTAYANDPDLDAHALLARRAASQGFVLLENRGETLPLKDGSKIALFGNASYDTFVSGTGSGNVNRAYKVDIADGLAAAGFAVDTVLRTAYTARIAEAKKNSPDDDMWNIAAAPEALLDTADIRRAALRSDAAIVTLSRMAGESADRQPVEGDWLLSDTERANIQAVCDAFHRQHKPVAVLLNMGSIVEMESWKDLPDAILHIWLPGQEAGNAVADILSGRVSPSGRLPMTIARRYTDYGSTANFPTSANPATVYYTDDIYVGYRHFDNADIEPLYPFGHGLTYTTFHKTISRITETDHAVTVDVDVTNTGQRPAATPVLLFVSAQADGLPMPPRELKGFVKTDIIAPGETRTVIATIPRDRLATFHPYHRRRIPYTAHTFSIL